MVSILKHKFEIAFGIGIILLFFVFRLPNLTLQPIFADEAIYIRWAQVMRAEPTLRFLPLSDGKTPLFMWSLMPVLKVMEDPLLAGRLLSVISGLFALLGVYFLGRKVFDSRVGFWAAFLYAIVPYTVFFDRMALVDSMLSAFLVWSLYFSIRLLNERRLDLSMILGFLFGGAVLAKSPAILTILMLPFTIVGLNFSRKSKSSILKLLMYWGLALFIAFGMYNLLRLGPNFHMLSSRDTDYVFPLSRIFTHPFDPFWGHTKQLSEWFIRLVGPVLIFLAFGTFLILKKVNRLGLALLIWALVPALVLITYLQTFTARYLFFTLPPLLVITAFGINEAIKKINLSFKLPLILILIAAWPIYFNFLLISKPEMAPLTRDERRGYLEDWTAGYGFSEIAEFLIDKKKDGGVVVGTEGFFGTLPDGLQIYLDKSGVTVIGSRATVSAQLRNAAKGNQTYFVGNKNRLPASFDNAQLIKEYPKPVPLGNFPQDAVQFYQIFPE